ncbi:tRNA pseudouridine(55) synthase TruB [Sphingorhabdus lutea]|uniref:tRNA pseudouridine synthase B n=1 Tax=Sphingorhabdus lutea TaxID=1913578 RepID=A0A1L3JCQ3_9SPHN|nr:tRNA pseudouridine(55) synthase TruB [Sphingorhabdus lutea]APG62904.1 tRNA pseudouridine(55) synthase TruB [Sphingorhabdus lutea]
MLSGWVILDKPLGMGSTQMVSAVKRNLREAGLMGKLRDGPKVGHGGTLDPLATGVLPIAIGEATKLCGHMLDAAKCYDFTICFGTETSGLDAEGEVVKTSDFRPLLSQIEQILPNFTGPIEQIPPAFSAIKIDGKRAYALAREGKAVEMKSRSVKIYSLKILAFERNPDEGLSSVTISAKVSKGTYIRSLARDISYAVESVGHVTMLRRTKSGPFTLDQAISLDKLNKLGQGLDPQDIILPFEIGLVDIPALYLSSQAAIAIKHGRVLAEIIEGDGLYCCKDAENRPLALIEITGGEPKIVRGFNL